MKRDICCTYDREVVEVFNAYVRAIRDAFAKDCTPQYYHTISFGLNFSFFYNMTGGVCTVHLIPFENGTAVDVRYSVIQPCGARYGAHCLALTQRVEQILGCLSKPSHIDVNLFLRPENQIIAPGDPRFPAANAAENAAAGSEQTVPESAPAPVAPPVAEPAPAPVAPPVADPAPAPVAPPMADPAPVPVAAAPIDMQEADVCTSCGAALATDARFCARCGTPRAPKQAEKFCSACGNKLEPDALFCTQCGKRQAT